MTRATLLALALLAAAMAEAQTCTGRNHILWPAEKPVWDFCWVAPPDSTGPDGSGLEIRYAFYKDKQVLWRMNVPVLNVLYDPGAFGCGPSYRDWMSRLAGFEADNVIADGYAEPTRPPRTTCDTPGSDPGGFTGVAVEDHADRIILTTSMQAAWYRYTQKITFHIDGRIEPVIGFTAVDYFCVDKPHTHHAYWRFDFDIDGAFSDRIRERKIVLFVFPSWSTVVNENVRNRASGRLWRVMDASGRGYELVPGAHDGNPPDEFAGHDVWLLRYHHGDTDDGGAAGLLPMRNAQKIDRFVNGESLEAKDVVLWYRVSHRHEGGLECTLVGPTLRPINW